METPGGLEKIHSVRQRSGVREKVKGGAEGYDVPPQDIAPDTSPRGETRRGSRRSRRRTWTYVEKGSKQFEEHRAIAAYCRLQRQESSELGGRVD